MERGRVLGVLLLAIGLTLPACASPDAVKLDDQGIAVLPMERGTKRITPQQIEYLRKKKIPFVLVDARPRAVHDVEHPMGAVSVPLDSTARVGPTLPRNELIVTLCTCPDEAISARSAEMFEGLGYANVAALDGGVEAWKKGNYAMEKGPLAEQAGAEPQPTTQAAASVKAGEFAELPLIVKIHADWCVRCQAIAPTWHQVEKELANEARIVVFDVTDETRLKATRVQARELGLEKFFLENTSLTGSVAVFEPGAVTPDTMLVAETNFDVYARALKKASAT
jgi:rhodanese-related sulfurtransferase